MVQTPDARSGDQALRVTYEEDENRGLAKIRIQPTDYLFAEKYVRYDEGYDFARGEKLFQFGSFDHDGSQLFNFQIVGLVEAKPGGGEFSHFALARNGPDSAPQWGRAQSDGNLPFEANKWHKFSTEVMLNTAGQSNGYVKIFLKDQLIAERTDIQIRSSNDHQFNYLAYGGWYSNGGVDPANTSSYLIDDISFRREKSVD